MKHDMILIIDCGGKQAYYTARKLRNESFYCELADESDGLEAVLARTPKGIMLVGDDEPGDPVRPFDTDYTAAGIPVLALGGAARRLALTCGAQISNTQIVNNAAFVQYRSCELFTGMRETDHYFQRADMITPTLDMVILADTPEDCPIAFGLRGRDVFAFQGLVEANDPEGLQLIHNFAELICKCRTMPGINTMIGDITDSIREEARTGAVLMPVFLNAESAVAARLLHRAIGNRLNCIFIDTGLLRGGDAQLILQSYREMDINCIEIDASDRILKALHGITDAHQKREVIRHEFSNVLTEQYLKLPSAEHIALSTTYSDILKHKEDLLALSLEGQAPLQPLALMFRDEIITLAENLNVPNALMHAAPFTVSGLSIRCLGEVTAEKLTLLRHAETIFHEGIEQAGYTRKVAQSFIVLTDLLSHGEHGMGYVCVLRAMTSSTSGRAGACRLPYDLMENVVLRITDEVRGISRVVYDITGRPTADLEWE